MRAIILVFDEPERNAGFMSKFCYCLQKSSLKNAVKLTDYLQNVLLWPSDNIHFLQSSFFDDTRQILQKLRKLFWGYRNEDLLFYYHGHGQENGSWQIGENKYGYGDKIISYAELEDFIKDLNSRLIFINECCYALALNKYLVRAMPGRYLLLGGSRSRCVSLSNQSILDQALPSWKNKQLADPRVYYTMADNKNKLLLDNTSNVIVPILEDAVARPFLIKNCGSGCAGTGIKWSLKKIFTHPRPSLRRGVALDPLMYPRF